MASHDFHSSPSSRLARRLGLGVLVGLLLIVGWIAWVRLNDPTVPLTNENLAEARKRWNSSEPADYDLDIKIGGLRAGSVHLEVRDGKVVAFERDGRTPAARRTWDVWTVPGQFEMLDLELAAASKTTGPFDASPGSRVVQFVEFDPQYGYPRQYRRFVLGSDDNVDRSIDWTITAFRVLKPGRGL